MKRMTTEKQIEKLEAELDRVAGARVADEDLDQQGKNIDAIQDKLEFLYSLRSRIEAAKTAASTRTEGLRT